MANTMPGVNAGGGDIGQQINDYFTSQGVGTDETPYWQQKWNEWGSTDPDYFNRRLQQADVFGGSHGNDFAGAAGGGGGVNYGNFAPFTQQFQAPDMLNLGGPAGLSYIPNAPQYQAPAYKQAPAFSYGDFQAPTAATEQNDPGYQFRLNEGARAMQQSAAAKGTLDTGGTLGDLLKYGQDYASNEFQNVYNRALQTYGTNRQNAQDIYNTNYQTQYQDPNQYNFAASQAQFAPQMQAWQTMAQAGQRQNELNYANAWNQYQGNYNIYRNNQNDAWGRQRDVMYTPGG